MKTKISSWSDIVQKNMKSAIITASLATPKKQSNQQLKKMCAVPNNFIIYGGEEEELHR